MLERREVHMEFCMQLVGDLRERILQFCNEIAKRTIMLAEREKSMDGILQTIAIIVGCKEVFEMMDKIQTLMQD